MVVLPLLAGIAILVWVFSNRGTETIDSDELASLVSLKNAGIANLENIPNIEQTDGSEAIELLSQLAEQLPDELIGHRNLAIAWLLMVDKVDRIKKPEEHATALVECRAAIDSLRTREPDSGVPHILAAKLAMTESDRPAAATQFELAAEKMSGDYVPWAELFMILRDDLENPLRQQALREAQSALPQNLVLLEQLTNEQAAGKSNELGQTLRQSVQALRPLAAVLAKQGIDIGTEIPDFIKRLGNADESVWEDAEFRMFQVFSVIRPEQGYQRDLDQLGRHILEYVIHDFSPSFYEHAPEPAVTEQDLIEVALVMLPRDGLAHITDAVDISVCDFDMDDDNDLIILRQSAVEVYSFDTEAARWQRIAQSASPAGMQHLCVADLDHDRARQTPNKRLLSDLDLLVYGPAGFQFFENRQEDVDAVRELVAVSEVLELEATTSIRDVAITDADHDGDLDLVLATPAGISIWSNSENWKFLDISSRSGLADTTPADCTSLVAIDWNRDVLVDVVAATDRSPAGRLENIRHGRFRWQTSDDKLQPLQAASSIAICDADGNGSWDLLSASEHGVSLVLTQSHETKPAWAIKTIQVATSPAVGASSWDYDNDGQLDILAWGPDGIEVYRGQQDGTFGTAWSPVGDLAGVVNSCRTADIDHDGDLDLASAVGGRVVLHSNEGGNQNHWVDIYLCAEAEPHFKTQRTNFYAIGSRVELKAGSNYQLQTVSGPVVHFGLGSQERADVVRVLFTNGIPQNVVKPEPDQSITELQRLLKGSCPYLYTWTGGKYEFYTDLLWAAPIGLQVAEGVVAPTRDWEYILIEGDRLVERDGEYRLQITEELWEAAYFDKVQLIAVDHPADVAVFSNEKVGPPSISEFGIHAIPHSYLQHPVSARDQQGRDRLPWINKRDGRYLKLFDSRHKQGLTDDYYLELDLGQLSQPGSIKLILSGWVFPTDTSVNVAISQNPKVPSPRAPSIWVPSADPADADGQPEMRGWRQLVPQMGFPGGKTKTIVVDIPADGFVDDDYRLRILTNMELYWDEIRFAVDLPEQVFEQRPLELLSADLHNRGFSRRLPGQHNGPERYIYDEVLPGPYWPPMEGNFTRFGDVTELVGQSDGRLVVMGAGDEMTIRFAAAGPPPSGWQRDFLLFSVGWDKDADLNTVSGHHVDPLPFPGMTRYPPAADDPLPDSSTYQDYLRRYQTRRQNPAQFWHQLR